MGTRADSFAFGFALVACGVASSARADSRLLLLGLETALPDAPLAAADAALLDAVRAAPAVRVVGAPLSRSVAMRASACAQPDDDCHVRITERARVDRLLYGTVVPIDDDHVVVRLVLFDRFARTTRHTVEGVIERDDLDHRRELGRLFEKIAPLAVRWPEEGAVRIRAMPGSNVYLDGRSMGTVPPSGEFDLRPLRVGRRMLRVVRPTGAEWVAPVVVPSREAIDVTVDVGGSLAEFDRTPAPARPSGSIEPPPDWVLTIPGVTEPTEDGVFSLGEGVSRVHFQIPLLVEHVQRGEIRTTTHARVGWLPNVGSGGARVTAKLRF